MKKFPSCVVTLPKDTFNAYIHDWFMPTNATPDIFSNLVDQWCVSSTNSKVPRIKDFPIASHQPRTGNNFAGVALSQYYREYLEVELSQPMIPGQVYCCEMYVSLSAAALWANDAIAMNFSENKLEGEDDIFLTIPQVTADSIITDTVNWVRVYATFKATQSYKYLTIGSFVSGAGSTKIIGEYDGQKYPGAYYYIDDISVVKIDFTKPVITGNVSVCPGDTLRLHAAGWEDMSWNVTGNLAGNGQKSDLIIKSNTSVNQYQVKGFICGWPVNDIVKIDFNPIPTINLGNDTLICPGASLVLEGGNDLTSFLWQDGSKNSTFTASSEGQFKLIASNNFGCKSSDSIQIRYYEAPQFTLGSDIEQCDTRGTLDASTGHTYDKYLWNNLSTNSYLDYFQEGTYWVTVTNPCGVRKEDTVTIQKVTLYLPNLVTANEDELNEKLVIIGAKESMGTLSVYNRYGSRIFKNDNYDNEWPERDMPQGIYYYEFKYPTCEVRKSWVEVIK